MNTKIAISTIITIVAVTTLFLVVPITGAFIVSYLFTLIAIFGIFGTLCNFTNSKKNAVVDLSYIYSAIMYGVVNFVFSVIACIANFTGVTTFVTHFIILSIYIIRLIALSAGGDYINTLNVKTKQKHDGFKQEKKKYWNTQKENKL